MTRLLYSHSRYGRRLPLLALAAILIAALVWSLGSALADSSSPSPASGKKIILQVGWYENIDSLNPFIGQQNVAYDVYRLNYDFLVNYDADTLAPIPGLATSWSHSPDGKTWVFKIRKDIRWQDGQPLTASDVAFTFNYIIHNQMTAYTNYTQFIKDAVALDPWTVRFDCSRPKAGILQMWVPILPKHIWGKISPADAQNKFQNPAPVIGSGAFQVVDWVKDQYVRLDANKGYWGGAPKIDEILFRIYTNQETEAADLRSGAIQYADVAPAQYRAFVNKPTWTIHKATDDSFENMGVDCYTLGPSTGNPVLKDWRFRNALNWAIDRRAIATIAYNGAAVPATSFLPSGYWKAPLDYHWQPPASEAYTYDPTKAGRLLDAAGYKEVNGVRRDHNGKPIALRLWAVTEKNQYVVASKLIAGYLEKIGLKVTLQTMDSGAIDDKLYNNAGNTFKPDFDLFVWGWGGDYDPGFLLSIFLTSQINGWSDSAWSDPQYDRLFEQQASELDPQKRKAIVWQMEQIIYQQSPYVVLVYPQTLQVYDTQHWQGWVRQPAGTGSVNNYWTYREVAPREAAAEHSAARWPAAVVAGAAIIIALAAWRTLRRRRKPVAEEVS
jgi:peptide/nickel transport system substrate-binding protein